MTLFERAGKIVNVVKNKKTKGKDLLQATFSGSTFQAAEVSTKCFSFAFDEQASAMACKLFDITEDELSELVGRYRSGKNKGKLRGELRYKEITSGGWYSSPEYDSRDTGAVVSRQKYDYQLVVMEWNNDIGMYAMSANSVKARVGSPIPLPSGN